MLRLLLPSTRWLRLAGIPAAACALVGLVSCGPSPAGDRTTAPESAPKAPPEGKLMNPRLADGTPVMMGFDSHHPDCFTFPESGKESVEVDCPDKVMQILHACRGARLIKTSPGLCTCVPVSEAPAKEAACPAGVETE